MKKTTQMTSPVILYEKPDIISLRGLHVVLDFQVSQSFGVETKRLNEAVKRNQEKFPPDFCFQLTPNEWAKLRSQFAAASQQNIDSKAENRVITGMRRSAPYAFTEHGVTMVAGLLRSPRAVALSIHIVREFVQLRRAAIGYAELSKRLDTVEAQLGDELKEVWEVLHSMLLKPAPETKPIGFIHHDR